jgi:hypothetical protein
LGGAKNKFGGRFADVPRGGTVEIEVLVGDVLDVPANVLVSTANP